MSESPASPAPVHGDEHLVIKEGYLSKRGQVLGGWQREYYALRGDGLYAYATANTAGKHKKQIYLPDDCTVQQVNDPKIKKPFVFKLHVNTRVYFFAVESEVELNSWVDAIRNRRIYLAGMSKPPGSPLTLETLQGLSLPLFQQRKRAEEQAPLPQYTPTVVPSESTAAAVQAAEPNLQQALDEEHWNEKYQQLVDMDDSSFDRSVEKGMGLATCLGQFVVAAKAIGKTIIDEFHLPVDQKSVKPCDLNSDAPVAEQEELYICNGMLFRFASDATGEQEGPGADDIAMKIAGHELKGLKAYQEANIAGLHTAMTCLVDHKGFRLIAIAVLPADGEKTMVYGVSPALMQNDFAISRMLKDAAEELNLKEHLVFADIHRPVTIHTSIEVQGHRCETDGRSYIINLARVFPADSPSTGSPEMLTALLRPEFVKKYYTPLSSDAFVNVGGRAPDQETNDNEARAASRYLQDVVINQFVQQLDMLELLPFDSEGLTSAMHSFGINARYLGRVAEYTRLPHVRDLCVTEMVARVCKRTLNQNLRALLRSQKELGAAQIGFGDPSMPLAETSSVEEMDLQIRLAVVDFFNLVLGAGPETDRFWYTVIVENIQKKFRFAINPRTVHRPALFTALQHHCGASFVDEDQYQFALTQTPLQPEDLVELRVVAKYVQNDRLDCNVLASKGLAFKNEGQFDQALQALNLKLDLHKSTTGLHNMECGRILNALASVYVQRGEYEHALLCANAALGTAKRFHGEAARIYNTLTESFYSKGDVERALECHNLALQAVRWHLGAFHPLLLEVHKTLAMLYFKEHKNPLALENYARALELSLKVLGNNHPTTAFFFNRVGHVHRAMGDLDKAAAAYEKALLINQTVLGSAHPTTAYSYFYMAEALQSNGQFTSARDYATKALNIREQLLGERHPLTLNSYYQMALVCDRMNEVATSIIYFTKILGYLKESGDESMLPEVQNVTKSIIKLKFRGLTPERTLILNKIRMQNRHFNDYDLLAEVVGELYDKNPSELVDSLFARIAAMDNEAYMRLACITQLVEDEEVMLRGARQPVQQLEQQSQQAFDDAASYASDTTRHTPQPPLMIAPSTPQMVRSPSTSFPAR